MQHIIHCPKICTGVTCIKNVKSWVRRCLQCIRFKTTQPAHGPIQLHLYQHPFHTLGVLLRHYPCLYQVTSGFSQLYAPIQTFFEQYLSQIKLQLQQPVPYLMMYFSPQGWSRGILTKGPICSLLGTFLLANCCSIQLTLKKLWSFGNKIHMIFQGRRNGWGRWGLVSTTF